MLVRVVLEQLMELEIDRDQEVQVEQVERELEEVKVLEPILEVLVPAVEQLEVKEVSVAKEADL